MTTAERESHPPTEPQDGSSGEAHLGASEENRPTEPQEMSPAEPSESEETGAEGAAEEAEAEAPAGETSGAESAPAEPAAADAEEAPAEEPAPAAEQPEAAPAPEAAEAPAESPAAEATAPATPVPRPTVGEIRVHYYGRTDVGLVREHNEDNFLVADLTSGQAGLPNDVARDATVGERGLVLAVCDGMGGAAAGEVASQMAVDTVYEVLAEGRPPVDRDEFARRLVRSVEEAGGRIFSAAKLDRSRRGMGTTSTVAGLIDKVLFVGQVGDSRAYVLRGETMELVTKDQSLVNQLIEAGQLTEEEAEAFEHSNIILQALGTTEEVSVDLTFLELRRGDRLMLCSDGLSGLVHGDMLKEVLQETRDLEACCRRLIEMANNGGGHDNITVIVADFDGEGLESATEATPPAYQQYPLPPADEETSPSGIALRDVSIKSGGPKPGADVKRTPPAEVAHPGEAPVRAQPVAEEPRAFGWWMIVIIVLLAAAAAAVAVAFGGSQGTGTEGNVPEEPQEPVVPAPPVEPQPVEVEVRVRTDITGTLYVDGERRGELRDGETLRLSLPVGGPYRFEARTGDSVVAFSNVTLREGQATDIDLLYPVVAVDAGPPEPAAVDAGPPEQPETPVQTAPPETPARRDAGTKRQLTPEEREAIRQRREQQQRERQQQQGVRPNQPEAIRVNPFDP